MALFDALSKKQKKKRGRGPFAAKTMLGLGGSGMGDQPQAIEAGKHRSEPDEHGLPHRAGAPDVPAARTPPLDILKGDSKFQRVVSMMPAQRISIMDRSIGSTKPVRIDVGIKDRTDVLIANMSDVVIWINTHSQYSSGLGYPLAPNTEAGAYNGGTLSIECTKDVEWYAIGASGAANLVVIVEGAR